MGKPFKGVLCLAFMPDAHGFQHGHYWRCCHRRAGHPGPHRCMGRWEWSDGDHESRKVKGKADKK